MSASRDEPVDVQRYDLAVPDARERGQRPGVLVAADDIAAVNVDRRMTGEDAHQFLSGKTGGAGNRPHGPAMRAGGPSERSDAA